ncbi:complement resistance protein TraT [Burkholderia vietnamiensis]|uniref:complement resistance protein TraT n=1 Tax=Burkholderia vietnamiensis TaxID=60552 RepID=UPI001FC9F37C|nr:complement resistance protein TraT [Burkholderia vietnamiensis]
MTNTRFHAEDHESDHVPSGHADDPSPPAEAIGSIRCTRCQSGHIEALNYARRAGGAIGTAAGASGAVAMALSGAEVGAAVGMLAGPVGSAVGGIAGAILAGLVGGAAGCVAGSSLGEVIDANILDNYRCITCGFTFGK